jgi:hypothetical protein
MSKSEIKNGDVMKYSNQLQTETNYTNWVKTINGEWERRMKHSKSRYKKNEYYNEKEKITLHEKVIEDRTIHFYGDFIQFTVSKNGVFLNGQDDYKTITKMDVKCRVLDEDWKYNKNEWYSNGWKIGVDYTKEVINRYLDLTIKEIEDYKNKIKELENKIELFNQ